MLERIAKRLGLRVERIYGGHNTVYRTAIKWGRLRFHCFHRGDVDPNAHDHPWDFVTFPLTSYVDEVHTYDDGVPLPVRLELVPAFRFTPRRAEHTHRLLGRWSGQLDEAGWPTIVSGKPVLTLVWHGRKRRSWGYKDRNGQRCGWTKYTI